MKPGAWVLAIPLALACTAAGASRPEPLSASFSAGLAAADSVVEAAVGTLVPGAVLSVSRNGRIVHERAFGFAQLAGDRTGGEGTARAMTTGTIFDLASVTKVMATAFALMLLVDRGLVDLDSPVHAYLPDFRGTHLDSITVRHLLQHSAGLMQWQPLYYRASTKAEAYAAIKAMPLAWGVGVERRYSDLGFMLLGYIVEAVSSRGLDTFLRDELYAPLGLRHTTFNPLRHGLSGFAATETGNGFERRMVYDSTFGYRYEGDPAAWNSWRDHLLLGEVNDGNAWYAHGGVAGHAGLFSTAGELHVLLGVMLNRGEWAGRRYLRSETVDALLAPTAYGHYLGWEQAPGGTGRSFARTGFTGTYVAGVPEYGIGIVLLTNRQHTGATADGRFANLDPLRAAVVQAIVAGARAESGSTAASPRFEATDFSTGRWFKGNTHTHTLESDGDSPPEVVANWYKRNGYDFLVISDHNVWVNPAGLSHLVDSTFLLIPGEEITTRFETRPVHVNGLNIPGMIEPRADSTLLGTIQRNVDAVREVEGVPHINHPNFGWALPQEILAQVRNNRLLEIHNGHPLVHNHGGGGHPGMEEVWDFLLSRGLRIYGIAVDDAHHFQGEFAADRANPGRGWVSVRAARLEARELLEQLERGRFYASTGVELDSIAVGERELSVWPRQRGDFRFTTEFFGRNGTLLLKTGENPATYRLSGSETYVRARVTDSGGAVAWLQPVFVLR
jgi:serine-type D-Ala-D-Ala carboxypeptidase